MVQINSQTYPEIASLALSSNAIQNKIGNTGITTFRGASDRLQLQQSLKHDSLELSSKQVENSLTVLPKVSSLAAAFSRLSSEVIDQINVTGKLPENMMVSVSPYGGYRLLWKNPLTNGQLTGGTQTLPPHLEVRKNFLGFATVVPKGYESWVLAK